MGHLGTAAFMWLTTSSRNSKTDLEAKGMSQARTTACPVFTALSPDTRPMRGQLGPGPSSKTSSASPMTPERSRASACSSVLATTTTSRATEEATSST